jgi:hypothetical protein
MDASPMFPKFHHPVNNMMNFEYTGPAKYYQRTARPVKYFVVDFGIARRYQSLDIPPLEDLILGGNKTLPEHRLKIDPCDPFATDIYYLGSLFETTCIKVRSPFMNIRCILTSCYSHIYPDNLISCHLSLRT